MSWFSSRFPNLEVTAMQVQGDGYLKFRFHDPATGEDGKRYVQVLHMLGFDGVPKPFR